MSRDQEPAETGQPPTTQAATLLTVGLLAKQPPDAAQPQHGSKTGDGTRRPSRRLWSARRIPAALTPLFVVAGAGMLLFDISMVRAGREAAAWRTRLAHELATRPLDDTWVLTGAALATALGLWLIILALTPGLRRHLPLKTPAGPGKVRAVLDRDAAALILRDAALRVPGVSRARIRVRRHRINARADIRFRDPGVVRTDLTADLHEQRERLALAHPPKLTVHVRQRRG
ncbi:DUF6286 domain-containing protein [Streptomyces agglomeratus]|uniref:DUF6286 domain-containing protein n=1 Tax=Streptomyces agglomeratus TaxID=285458 RepID=UPI000ABF1315|nr:DUF6286 domain-containing protein [Streptomyces agglomeratus]